MKFRNSLILASTTLLCAACTSFEGAYSPNCAAYEGDRISLNAGRFTWDRFTDAIPVDDAGNPADPLPEYPMRGTYTRDGGVLSLRTDSGDTLESLHVRREHGRYYLLTEAQMGHLERAGEVPQCALVLGGFD